MNRGDIRETIKMQLTTVDYALSQQYSDPFLNKLIEKEHTDVLMKCRALKNDTILTPGDIQNLDTEDYHELLIEMGEVLLAVIDSYVELSDIERFHLIEKITFHGERVQYLKYDNVNSFEPLMDVDVPYYYLQGDRIYFIHGSGQEFNLYYTAKPAPIVDDVQELELKDDFEDAVVYGVIKRLAMGNKTFDYNMINFEYREALDYAKEYYRKKYIYGTGTVIPQPF